MTRSVKERVKPVAPGDLVRVRTAFGGLIEKVAVTGVIAGDSFQVVRLCSDEEWTAARAAGREPRSSPWPAEDVIPRGSSQD
jgi:hypothetical protein